MRKSHVPFESSGRTGTGKNNYFDIDGKCSRKQSKSREEKVFADLSRNCQQAEGYGVSVVAGVVKKMLGSTAKLETKGADTWGKKVKWNLNRHGIPEIYKGRRKTHVRNELWLGIEKNDNLKG